MNDSDFLSSDGDSANSASPGSHSSDSGDDLPTHQDCLRLINAVRHQWPRSPDVDCPGSVGRFSIQTELGRGTFGIVYRGTDPVSGRSVAIKTPRPEVLLSDELSERFRREALFVSELDHPFILPLHECQYDGGIPFLVMPYIAGGDLKQWIRARQTIDLQSAVQLVRRLADAVAHAHSRGVLHRDLKPTNVLLEEPRAPDEDTPTPRLTDFGLARWLETDSDLTQAGTLIGTTCYMAPEQADGRSGHVTCQSDIYSLGVILYELLTGHAPFQGSSDTEIRRRIVTVPPDSPRLHNPLVPADLAAICLKCLEKSPARRYSTAGQLHDDLTRWLNGEPVSARSASIWRHLRRFSRRKPRLSLFLSASAALILLLSGFVVWHTHRLQQLLTLAQQQNSVIREHTQKLRLQSCQVDVRLAQVAWDEGNANQAMSLLTRHIPEDGQADVRGFEWWCLWDRTHRSRVLSHRHQGRVQDLKFSPDGMWLAACGVDGDVVLSRLSDFDHPTVLSSIATAPVMGLAFSPDSSRLALLTQTGRLIVYDVAGGLLTHDRTIPNTGLLDVCWCPHTGCLITAGKDGSIRLHDPLTGEVQRELTGHKGAVTGLLLHPRTPLLVSSGTDGSIRFWNMPDGTPDQRLTGAALHYSDRDEFCLTMDFSTDGRFLLTSSSTARVRLYQWSPEGLGRCLSEYSQRPITCELAARGDTWITGDTMGLMQIRPCASPARRSRQLRGHISALSAIAVSPDGETIASGDRQGYVRIWPSEKFPEHPPISPVPLKRPQSRPVIAQICRSDNQLLVQTCETTFDDINEQTRYEGVTDLFDAESGKRRLTLPTHAEEMYWFSPAGEQLVVTDRRGTIRSLSSQDGRQTWQMELPAPPAEGVPPRSHCAWSPDGEFLAVNWLKQVYLLDAATGKTRHCLSHPSLVTGVQFTTGHRNPGLLLTTGLAGTLRHWCAETGVLQKQFRAFERGGISALCLSSSGQRLALGSSSGRVRVYRWPHMQPVAELCHTDSVMQLGFVQEDRVLLSRSVTTDFTDLSTGRKLLSFPPATHTDPGRYRAEAFDRAAGPFVVTPDRQQVIIPLAQHLEVVSFNVPSAAGTTTKKGDPDHAGPPFRLNTEAVVRAIR